MGVLDVHARGGDYDVASSPRLLRQLEPARTSLEGKDVFSFFAGYFDVIARPSQAA